MARKTPVDLPILPKNLNLNFSFKFYDEDREEYCLSCWKQKEIKRALKRLKQLSDKTLNQLRQDRSFYHFHEVIWEKTTEKRGFSNNLLDDLPHFQFMLPGINSQKARVFGALQGNTFFIVWFDLNHDVCISNKKHT